MLNKIILLFLFFVLAVPLFGCSETTTSETSVDKVPKNTAIKDLKIIELNAGEGEAASNGRKVALHYSGWIYDDTAKNKKGKLFDTSSDLGEPLVFRLGKQQVIKGWDVGVIGMQVGEKRRLLIPSDMAYGARRIGTARTPIPANSALVFDVELIELGTKND